MTKPFEFKVNQPECDRAISLANQAEKAAEADDFATAIPLIEEAIKLDYVAALSQGFYWRRAKYCAALGQDAPQKAVDLYTHGCELRREGRYRDARLAHLEAASLDPLFPWPLNNLAWMLATAKEPAARNGQDAVKYATQACEKSNWNCYSFVNTLAAAYAEAGDFEKAVGWQKATLEIVPEKSRLDYELMLKHFQQQEAYVDEGLPTTGGSEEKESKRLLRPENTTIDALKELFNEAYLETAFDDDNDLWVIDEVKVMVRVVNKGSQITFSSVATPRRNANLKERLQFVNRVNSSVNVVRASMAENGLMVFDYSLPVVGGVSKQAVVFALRYFMGATVHAKEKCDTDGIFGARTPGQISFSEN